MGLVQREIEAAGFTTITLSPIPDLTASVCVPRIAAIEYPLGRTLGQPGDAAGQMAVLRATLAALESIRTPGGIVNLPFEWPAAGPKQVRNHPPEAPPIARYLARNPWFLRRLLGYWRRFVVGYFFNEFLKSVMGLGMLLILTMLPLSVYAAYAHDAAG